ncbi:MAG TPA: GNAT family N-acetyltransferase [Longimicrobium sp.]|nr:GNAT family N-acetyltransferase [Longimicrobium sp.]
MLKHARTITAPRLTLVAATVEHVRTELEAPERLASLLDAEVSAEWPTGEYDRDAMEFFRARLEEGGEAAAGWYGWYALRAGDADGPRALVGAGGYFGPPGEDGIVEIGYSVVPRWQRRGYASEIVDALVARAFELPHVTRVIAHTTPANAASVGVLRRCGFSHGGAGAEPGSIRFERARHPAG